MKIKMKNNLLFFLLSLSITASAQSLEFNFGTHLNNLYDFKEKNGPYTSSYSPKVGYDLNVGIDDIYLNTMRLRFTLGLSIYGGGIKASQGENGGNYSMNGEIEKTVLRLGFYPVNFRIKKRLNISIGPQFSMLIHEKIKGTYDEWHVEYNEYNNQYIVESSGNLNERYDSYNARYYVGANIRIAYRIPLSEDFYLVPQYALYIGISNEFVEFPNITKSINNILGIGIKRKI